MLRLIVRIQLRRDSKANGQFTSTPIDLKKKIMKTRKLLIRRFTILYGIIILWDDYRNRGCIIVLMRCSWSSSIWFTLCLLDPVLSQFRSFDYVSTLRSKLTRDKCKKWQMLVVLYDGTQEAIPNQLWHYLCQSKWIPYAHPNSLPILSTERLRDELRGIFDYTESRDTGTDESDEKDSSSFESIGDFAPSPDRNNTLLESNNSLSPAEGDILTEPECWKFILEGR